MISLPDLREALGCGLEAAAALETGENDLARDLLAKALPPSVRAFPPGTRHPLKALDARASEIITHIMRMTRTPITAMPA